MPFNIRSLNKDNEELRVKRNGLGHKPSHSKEYSNQAIKTSMSSW